MKTRDFLMAAFVACATVAFSSVASAQTQAECEAGIEEVNTAIGSQEGVVEGARDEARNLSEEASNANAAGEYARCMELVEQAKGALTSN